MKRQWWCVVAAFALGVVCVMLGQASTPLVMLSNAAQTFGQWLRHLSLSGNAGNLASWAICLLIALLPTAYILLARQKRKQASDSLWPLTSLALFAGMYFLVNPALTLRFLPSGILHDNAFAGWFSVFPFYAALSLLLACVLLRWSGSLSDGKLIFWLKTLLLISMLITGISMGGTLALACAEPATFPMILAELITDAFWLVLLDGAQALLSAMEKNGWFHAETERLAKLVAQRAQWSLIAAVCATAARNVLVLLMGRWLSDINLSLEFPLSEMILSCGALLIARCLVAACRVQHDNDLMI